jgi:hypothetical protein
LGSSLDDDIIKSHEAFMSSMKKKRKHKQYWKAVRIKIDWNSENGTLALQNW